MRWNRRSKYHATSECGQHTCAAFAVADSLKYRASKGGIWITEPLDSIDAINKALNALQR